MSPRLRLPVLLASVLAAACGNENGTRGCQLVRGASPPTAAAAALQPDEDSGTNPALRMPLISRNLPTFASAKSADASKAFDADYGTSWRSGHEPTTEEPDWIAIDLSSVPAARRATVYSVWFNEAGYSYETADGHGYALPGDYQIQASGVAGGSRPPADGWVTMATRAGNTLSSGAHLLHLSNANWLRFVSTKKPANAAAMNVDTGLQWDLYDAHAGLDAWKFGGDSITANAMGHQKTNDSFNQLVHKQVANFPAFEMAGHGFWGSAAFLQVIDAYLQDFPGRFFALSLGTNDGDPAAFYENMSKLVAKVLAAGHVPVVPTIPYTGEPSHLPLIPRLNLEVTKLYATFGDKLVKGPDLYSVLSQGRASYFDNPADLHPNARGNLAIREAWADAMVKSVYR
jgi:acyl-CoA thioesterase-1